MTLTFPLLCFPFLLDFLRISLWDSHKYFARHFRILAGEGAGAGTALWGCYDDDMDFFFTLYAAAIRSQCPVFCLPDPGETRTRWRCSWLHRRILCPFQPFLLLLLLQHVCNALCGFDFHCESENENENANGCCTSVRSTAIRFYHQWNLLYLRSCASLFSLPQVVSYSTRSPSPSLSLYRCLSPALGSCNSCASLALCWTFSQVSRDPGQGICLLSTVPQDFLSDHWAVVAGHVREPHPKMRRNLHSLSCDLRGISCCFWLDLANQK